MHVHTHVPHRERRSEERDRGELVLVNLEMENAISKFLMTLVGSTTQGS